MRTWSTGRSSRGFTLLELLLVLAIIVLAMAWLVPRMGGGERGMFESKVREAVGILGYARRSAILTGRPVSATFYPGDDPRTGGTTDWVGNGVGLRWQEESRNGAILSIEFYPQGGSSGGELIFSRDRFQAKVSIDSFTGRIKTDLDEQDRASAR